jgi:peptidoglycan hydrolase-like protein with peptidoglycan-binding domain
MVKAILNFFLQLFGQKKEAPKALPEPELKLPKGDTNGDTKELQAKLKRLGYSVSGGTDGQLGDRTMGSVQDFLDDQEISDNLVEKDEGVSDATVAAVDKAIEEAGLPDDIPLKVGDDGAEVLKLQKKLIALGFDLPRFGADGDFGGELVQAVLAFQVANGITDENAEDDQGIGDDTYEAVMAAELPEKPPAKTPLPYLGKVPGLPSPANFHVTKDNHELKKGYGRRKIKDIVGVTLHQTACVLGEKPGRWDNVACHVGITRGGKVLWVNDFEKIVWHGHGFNRRTIGIEIDGHFAGLEPFNEETGEWEPDLSTYWRPKGSKREPVSITEAQIKACKEVLRWLNRVVEEAGGDFKYCVAHRQSSGSRRGDPGEKTWKLVALPMMEELDLTEGGEGYFILDKNKKPGFPISKEWDPRYEGTSFKKRPRDLKGRKKSGPY